MESDIFNQIKNNLEQIDNKEETRLKKIEIEEIKIENKRLEKIKKGTQSVYCEIWKQVLKNVKKACFNIYIYITYDGNKNFYVRKIKVNNNIKKITKIPVNRDYLEYLLNNDGLSLHTLQNSNLYGDKSLFVVPIVRFDLRNIVDKKTKQKKL